MIIKVSDQLSSIGNVAILFSHTLTIAFNTKCFHILFLMQEKAKFSGMLSKQGQMCP